MYAGTGKNDDFVYFGTFFNFVLICFGGESSLRIGIHSFLFLGAISNLAFDL